jgi:hypothetical protein
LRRDNLIKAEQRYALALTTHSADLIEARAELQKFVEREDEVIQFRAGVDQVEKEEQEQEQVLLEPNPEQASAV